MTDPNLDLQTVAKRMENMEKYSRRIKVMGFFAIVLGILAGLLGGIISPSIMSGSKYIKAEKIELIDKKGQTRGLIFVDENDNAAFVLFDETGNNQRLSMFSFANGQSLIQIDDDKNQKAVVLGSGLGSDANLNSLALFNKEKLSIGFSVNSDGITNMLINDKNEHNRFFLGLNKNGDSQLELLGEGGTSAFDLTASKNGDRMLRIKDNKGKARNVLSIIDNKSLLSLLDDNGKIKVALSDEPELLLLKDKRVILKKLP